MEKTASEIATVKRNVRLQEWNRQIEEQKSSGLNVQEWCQHKGINSQKRDELVYTPARFHIRRHIIKVYKCTKCGSDPDKDAELDDIEPCHIVKAYCQKPMIPGSYCSPELLKLC